ncbi:hypothetical protein [Photorhabdus luminescens]|nr:hypothetical protein [Photorhabdus luminescens]
MNCLHCLRLDIGKSECFSHFLEGIDGLTKIQFVDEKWRAWFEGALFSA